MSQHYLIIPDCPQLSFDAEAFLTLLEGSFSLSKTEKKTIISRLPLMTQQQLDEIILILKDEKAQFAKLTNDSPERMRDLHDTQEKAKLDPNGTEKIFDVAYQLASLLSVSVRSTGRAAIFRF